ncbi:40S ribosomal protein S10 [Geodia barretti]|uniref:40S ribosomal protein S10 n=1 Tax=Geodia barretti TaxID=519541 RepID=A0AA35XKK2_GEOBA|nr:40S ribosomal protein S10 [Geodia barretti]
MLIPKKNRKAIYEHLFKEGVLVAKKDYFAAKHSEIETVPNLQVIKAMQSLKSRGYVTERFIWQYFFWYLTNDDDVFVQTPLTPLTLGPETTELSF